MAVTDAITDRYRDLRSRGYVAAEALRNARISDDFDWSCNAGGVKLEWVPDKEPYDVSFVYSWGLPANRANQVRADIQRQISRDGLYRLVGSYLGPDNVWVEADSVGGVIGFCAGGYEFDVMANVMRAREDWVVREASDAIRKLHAEMSHHPCFCSVCAD